MIVLYILGPTFLVMAGLDAKQDIWIAFLIGIAVSLVLMCMYARIISHIPGKDFYGILESLLGRPLAVIFFIFMAIYSFLHYAYVLGHFGNYINAAGLPGTPVLVPLLSMGLLTALAVLFGIDVLGKWSEWSLVLVAAFIIGVTLLLTKNMNMDNLRPSLENGFAPIAKGTYTMVLYPFGQVFAFLLILPPIKKKHEPYHILTLGILIGGILSFLPSISNILVQGVNTVSKLYYPSYSTLAIVRLGYFVQRLEILANIIFTLAVFLKLAVVLMGLIKSLAQILKLDRYGFLVFPLVLLAINYGINAYSGNLEHQAGLAIFVPYFSTFFQIIIPVLLFILLEWKAARQKRKHGQQALSGGLDVGAVDDAW